MKNIVETAVEAGTFKTLVAAVSAAGLADALSGGEFTVFAPNDAAFAKLPEGTVEELLKPENLSKLGDILKYHVVAGKIMAADVLAMNETGHPATLQGGTLEVTNVAPVTVNGVNVIATDIEATNGVIHVIDSVLMPA
jgi:transforming growth factor-beta-induced protein